MNLPFSGDKGPIVRPGTTIGILGGGQLGRMTALAAANLGYRCHVYCPEADSPAAQVAAATTQAPYDDRLALEAFARACGVVTFEFENIPVETLDLLARVVPVRPSPKVLRIGRDRVQEKSFCNAHDIATAPWRPVAGPQDIAAALEAIGRPAVLKTARFGYDGKGQVRLGAEPPATPAARAAELESAWLSIMGTAGPPPEADQQGEPGQQEEAPGQQGEPPQEAPAILEGFVNFEREISVITARGLDGAIAPYIPVENEHKDHILARTLVPARISPILMAQARAIACQLAEALDLVGLLAVEMFVTRDGRLLVNEMAPRPHNSGHWTQDACRVSQFEQFVRAICGLPLGPTERHFDVEMLNLIGDEVANWEKLLADPDVKLHLYGKKEVRAGRKMGHANRLWVREPIPGPKLGEVDPMGCP